MKKRGRVLTIVFGVLLLAGIAGIAGGGYLIFVHSVNQVREAREVRDLPVLAYAQVIDQVPDTRVAVTGTLFDNAHLDGEQQRVTPYDLVAYTIETWDLFTDSDGDTHASWDHVETNIPVLILRYDGGNLALHRPNPGAELDLSGAAFETIIDSESGRHYRDIRAGSLRIRGLRNDDTVTVLGRTVSGGAIAPERLHAGDRDSLVRHMEDEAQSARITGVVFLAVGIIFALVSLTGVILVRLR